MKKIFTLFGMILCTLAALANEYTDKLTVTVNGDAMEQQATISITQNEDGKYTLSLNNFCLEQVEDDGTVLRMGVGNIVLADREGTTVNGITSITYNDDLIITDGDDPEIPFWIGSALGPVPIEMEARFNDTQLYCEIHINLMDLLGQLIDVVFGAEPEAVEEEAITAPTISLKEGVRNMVTIGVGTTSLENGSVTTYFTIDGTDPSAENGTAITEDTDVALSEDCTVKAVTVSSSGKQSEVVAFDFTYEVESGISQMTDAAVSRKARQTFDLLGRKVAGDSRHSLYIVNGRKMVIR